MAEKSQTKTALALLMSVLLGPIMVWAGLIGALSIAQQFLAGLFDLSQASWSSFLNPLFWFGVESIGGTGGLLDALIGGPGAPGGTVSRYITFMLFAALTAICYAAISAMWTWARTPSESA